MGRLGRRQVSRDFVEISIFGTFAIPVFKVIERGRSTPRLPDLPDRCGRPPGNPLFPSLISLPIAGRMAAA